MKYNLLCFQISGTLIIFFNKHVYQVSTSLMKENKRYKRLKTAKWISIRKLVPGLLLTVRSAGCYCLFILFYFILFYFILFYFILFYFILFYFILFYFILFYFILFYFILFYFILF